MTDRRLAYHLNWHVIVSVSGLAVAAGWLIFMDEQDFCGGRLLSYPGFAQVTGAGAPAECAA